LLRCVVDRSIVLTFVLKTDKRTSQA